MILRYAHNQFTEWETYRQALRVERSAAPVISIVGAGGKTTLIGCLADEYVKAEIDVIVTTTTHMYLWDLPYFYMEKGTKEDFSNLDSVLEQEGQLWIGRDCQNGKMTIVREEIWQYMLQKKCPVLVEADGSRRLPCKAPGEQEPVLPFETGRVLAVYGLSALGKPIRESCFRPERVAGLLQKEQTEPLTEEDMAALAASNQGGRKYITERIAYTVVLNQADTKERIRQAEEIAGYLQKRGICDILVTSNRV